MNTKWRTAINPKKSEVNIEYGNPMVFLGSCFSEHIASKMETNGFRTIANPLGIMYNPASLALSLEYLLNQKELNNDAYLIRQDHHFHYDLHSDIHATSFADLGQNLRTIHAKFIPFWNQKPTLFITLGTAWAYRLTKTDHIVANCHKQAGSLFQKVLLTEKEITTQLVQILSLTQKEQHIIFTISPVRHLKNGIVENQLSKARLISAVHQIASNYPQCHYFPSYEIMMDDLRDYRFYKADMIHPNEQAIDYIWSVFQDFYFLDKTKVTLKEVTKIKKMKEHRSLFPNSLEDIVFQEKLERRIENFKSDNPMVTLH